MRDLFLFLHEAKFTGYTDDDIPIVIRGNISNVISDLGEIGQKLLTWFSHKELKLNTDRCHLLMSTQDQKFLKIGNCDIKNYFSEKLLGITFDCKLKFSSNIVDIWRKVTRKLNALCKILLDMDISRRKIIHSLITAP